MDKFIVDKRNPSEKKGGGFNVAYDLLFEVSPI
jgi:hypothetical protein